MALKCNANCCRFSHWQLCIHTRRYHTLCKHKRASCLLSLAEEYKWNERTNEEKEKEPDENKITALMIVVSVLCWHRTALLQYEFRSHLWNSIRDISPKQKTCLFLLLRIKSAQHSPHNTSEDVTSWLTCNFRFNFSTFDSATHRLNCDNNSRDTHTRGERERETRANNDDWKTPTWKSCWMEFMRGIFLSLPCVSSQFH